MSDDTSRDPSLTPNPELLTGSAFWRQSVLAALSQEDRSRLDVYRQAQEAQISAIHQTQSDDSEGEEGLAWGSHHPTPVGGVDAPHSSPSIGALVNSREGREHHGIEARLGAAMEERDPCPNPDPNSNPHWRRRSGIVWRSRCLA